MNAEHIEISKLLQKHDEAFIDECYRIVLGRAADNLGKETYLTLLRNGENKVEIIGRIRYSKEGTRAAVQIPGLFSALLKQRIFHIPVLGRIVNIVALVWSLPSMERRLRALENGFDVQKTKIEVQESRIRDCFEFACIVRDYLKSGECASGSDNPAIEDVSSLSPAVRSVFLSLKTEIGGGAQGCE